MLVRFEIKNFRCLRDVEIDFCANREDLSEKRKGRDGDEVRLIRAGYHHLVPVKNIIGLSSYGKSTVMDAIETAVRISSGDLPLNLFDPDNERAYQPCLETAEGPAQDTSYRLDFTYNAGGGKVYIIRHCVAYNGGRISYEELCLDGVSLYQIRDGAFVPESGLEFPRFFSKMDLEEEARRTFSTCLTDDGRGHRVQFMTMLAAMSDNDPKFVLLSKIAADLRQSVSFVRVSSIRPEKLVEEFESFIGDLMPLRDATKFSPEEHRAIAIKTFLGKMSTVFSHVSNIDTVRYGEDPQTGEPSLWCSHSLPDGHTYETKLQDEGTSPCTLFLILLRCLRATFFGSTAVVDDFNLHIPSFAQLFLLKLFKSENNTNEGQLVAIHYGDRIMLPDGEECADEVCCLRRTPEQGTQIIDGPTLRSSEDVTFCDVKRPHGHGVHFGPEGVPQPEKTEKLRTVKKSRRKKSAEGQAQDDEFYFELDDGESC